MPIVGLEEAIVNLERSKNRLRIIHNDENDDIMAMIEEATSGVIRYVDDATVTDAWDSDTVPQDIRAGVLTFVQVLFERSPDEPIDPISGLPKRVVTMLYRWRKPALA